MAEQKTTHCIGCLGFERHIYHQIKHIHLLGFKYVVLKMNHFMLSMLIYMVRTAGSLRKT